MTTRKPKTYADWLEQLDQDTAAVLAAREKVAELEKAARATIAGALKAGVAENLHGARSEVTKRSPFSPPVVRAIGEEAGVPADRRYDRTRRDQN